MASLQVFTKLFKPAKPINPVNGFSVDKVNKADKPLPAGEWSEVVSTYCSGVAPEAFSKPASGRVVIKGHTGPTHGFATAVDLAYSSHYPLVISPDNIWMCVVQGFAAHVNANHEKLRHLFVEYEGRKEIKVRRDDFVKGSPDNPWEETFSEFSSQIRSHIGEKTHDLLVPNFTTTGPTEKAASEIVMMNAFKQYFDYSMCTMCGIPEVILKGTVDDWKQLRDRALGLAQFELQWWISVLEPVLDQLVATSEGHVDKKFWSSLYKLSGGSGGPYISGWILTLFPYTGNEMNRRNNHLKDWKQKPAMFGGFPSSELPPGVASVPFNWEYLGENFKMLFYAGFMGVSQDPDSLGLSAEVGWAVAGQEAKEFVLPPMF